MKLEELSQIMLTATNDGVAKVLGEPGAKPGYITKAKAYRIYGRSNIDRWLAEHLILPSATAKSTKKFLDKNALERVAGNSNRNTYLPVADRKL